MSQRAARSPIWWLGGLLTAYLAVPLVGLLVRLGEPGAKGLDEPGLWSALAVSLATASISAALIALFGVPLAYLLARHRGRASSAAGALVQLPLALPPLMSGILLVYVVGPDTPLGRLFGGRLTDTLAGIVIAQTFVAAPFLVVAARSAFHAIDGGVDDVARTLGHGESARFLRVALPLAMPGITAGLLLAWLRAFGEFGATVILAYHPYSLPVFTYVQFGSSGVPATIAPTALALAAALVILTVVRWRPPRKRRRSGTLPAPSPPLRTDPKLLAFSVEKGFGNFRLGVSHDSSSPRLAILGRSGAGKSATLKCIAGLLRPESGYVRLGRRQVGAMPAEQRGFGYVPQEISLFPHLSVWSQLLFGVAARGDLAAYWLEALRLRGLEDRMPHQLSGGERQRVALARALATSPKVVLLDEPFSSLDAPVRDELRRELRHVQRSARLGTVLVTHDPEEAAILADEVMVIADGHVLQAGPTRELFSRPASPEVARLLGIQNLHRGVVTEPGWMAVGQARIQVSAELPAGTAVLWCVRPERVELTRSGRYRALVVDRLDLGSSWEVLLELDGGTRLRARSHEAPRTAQGLRCQVDVDPMEISVWPAPGSWNGERSGQVGQVP